MAEFAPGPGGQKRVDRKVRTLGPADPQIRGDTQSPMRIEAYEVSSTQRKKIEALTVEAEFILAVTRLRLRRLASAEDAFPPTR